MSSPGLGSPSPGTRLDDLEADNEMDTGRKFQPPLISSRTVDTIQFATEAISLKHSFPAGLYFIIPTSDQVE